MHRLQTVLLALAVIGFCACGVQALAADKGDAKGKAVASEVAPPSTSEKEINARIDELKAQYAYNEAQITAYERMADKCHEQALIAKGYEKNIQDQIVQLNKQLDEIRTKKAKEKEKGKK